MCTKHSDIVLVIDCSFSLKANEFNEIRNYASEIVSRLEIDSDKTHVGVVKFGYDVEFELYLKTSYDKNVIMQRLSNMQRPENYKATNTSHALYYALKLFQAQGRDQGQYERKVILVTDGRSTDTEYLWSTVNKLVDGEISRYCVGVGDEILGGKKVDRAQNELKGIAGNDAHVILAPTFPELHTFVDDLMVALDRCGKLDVYHLY